MNQQRQRTLLAMLAVLLAGTAAAQAPVNGLMEGMAVNNKQLRQYTFKQRTETYHQGDLKNAKVDEVHYNAAGERVGIPLDERRRNPKRPAAARAIA